MNAPPAALNQQQSAFGINELTTQLVLRLVKDDELLACGCVSKVLERAVDDARDGTILRARRHRRTKSPWHIDLAHGDDAADGTRRRPLRWPLLRWLASGTTAGGRCTRAPSLAGAVAPRAPNSAGTRHASSHSRGEQAVLCAKRARSRTFKAGSGHSKGIPLRIPSVPPS